MNFIKAGKRVTVKVTLPKHSQWALFRNLLLDLGFSESDLPELFHVIRHRKADDLSEVTDQFDPRRMLDTGTFGSSTRDVLQFYRRYQAGCFLKKYPFKGNQEKCKEAAMRKFIDAENICLLYNRENYKALLSLDASHPDFLGIIQELRDDIKALLRKVPSNDCIAGNAMHGPGVSVGDSYKHGHVTCYFKYAILPYSVTQLTLPYARYIIESDPRWIGALDNWYRDTYSIPYTQPKNVEHFWDKVFKVVDNNRITTVPKSITTDRTIAIEPVMNVYLQLGIDRIIRQRLRYHWGYNLNDQTLNQELANLGSVTNDLSTVDLKMASETISMKICELLLPEDWFSLLVDLRSPNGLIGSKKISYSKMSSTGNGFTFALETVIFASLVRCAMRRTGCSDQLSAVYGDDIIIPKAATEYLVNLLNICGFRTNVDKTFTEGPFRESCGTDWFLGDNIRPFFLKRALNSVQDLMFVYNSLTVLEKRLPWFWGIEFPRTKDWILKHTPLWVYIQFRGPATEDLDTHFFDDGPYFRDIKGRYYWKISPVARSFNRRSNFFFRKLMVQPGRKIQVDKWSRHLQRGSSGNAFDITKRDRVLFKSTKCQLP